MALQSLQSNLQSGNPDRTARAFMTAHQQFGQEFLDTVRKEKILFRIYSIEHGEAVSKAIHRRVTSAAEDGRLSYDEARHILHFINEHRVIITPKIHINGYLDELTCWQTQREIALLEVAAELEAQLRRHQKTMEEKLKETDLATRVEGQLLIHSGVKNLLEDGVIVIRELLRRNPKTASTQPGNFQWNEVLMLAERWGALQRIEDRYAYFHQELFIDSGKQFDLVVCRPRSFALEGALDFAEYRAANLDLNALQIAQSNTTIDVDKAATQIIKRISTGSGVDFEILLTKMPLDIETYIQVMRSGRRQAVEESHLMILESTDDYETRLSPFLRAWECLYRLTVLRKLALDKLSETHPLNISILALVLSQETLVQYLQEFGKMNFQQAKSALRLLMFKPDKDRIGSYDPYLKPMISLGGRRVLVLDAYIWNGRFARNSLKLLVEQNLIDLDICGRLLEQHFQEILEMANFKTNKGRRVKIVGSDGDELTDLDVVGYCDGVLFLGQAKAVIPPGSTYEIYRMLQRLREAAIQLRSCVENITVNEGTIKRAIGLSDTEPFAVKITLPYILTNDIHITGHKIDGFLVLDPIILEETLNDLASNRSGPNLLEAELESFASRHEEHVNRVAYHELNLGGTVFLVPGVSLFPRIG